MRGYHKPIMIAGGFGNIRAGHVQKASPSRPGAAIVVLGGPAMLIGLGGGAASSMASGASHEDLDFASVQRDNPEMQRRCQEVIDRCWALGDENPIVSIHDVGAGGLSNALPELVHDSGRGAVFELRQVPNDEPGLSPLEIWCNEAQERYVLAVAPERLDALPRALRRASAAPSPWSGTATAERAAGAGRRALRRPAHRHAALGAARQAAPHAARRHPGGAGPRRRSTSRGVELRRGGAARAPAARRWPTRPSSSPSATAP